MSNQYEAYAGTVDIPRGCSDPVRMKRRVSLYMEAAAVKIYGYEMPLEYYPQASGSRVFYRGGKDLEQKFDDRCEAFSIF